MPTRKTKDIHRDSVKTHISAVSVAEMVTDQQALFEKAVDVLLADLMQSCERQTQEKFYELEGKSMAEQAGTRRGASKR